MERGNEGPASAVTGMELVALEQQEIIESLASHNRHLIELLTQFMAVDEEEARLSSCLEKRNAPER